MKKIIFIIVVLTTITGFSQTKYFIYFKDKGINKNQTLSKSSNYFQKAINHLSERSVNRRIKNMGEENYITYEDIPVNEVYVKTIESFGIKISRKLKWFNAITAFLTNGQINEINNLSFVDSIEPVKTIIFDDNLEERTTDFKKQQFSDINYGPSFWQLNLSLITTVQQKGITGDGVVIGILDTGFDWKEHESLDSANVIAEYDFVFNDNVTANQQEDRADQDNHGTLVFSIIGGHKEGELVGSSFGSSFVLAKTEYVPTETHVEEDNYAAALEWMDSIGVDVTNSSLGYNEFDAGEGNYSYSDMNGETAIVTKASELAFERGIVTVVAAGNEGSTGWKYIIAPADGFNTIAVGAVTSNNNIAGFSSIGPTYDGRIKPDIVAMGVNVYGASASGFDSYIYSNGTSVASPIVSGAAALLLSANPYLTNVQVKNILLETASNSDSPNNVRGYGLLYALGAVEYPNIEVVENQFYINKYILQKPVVPSTIRIHYSDDGKNFAEDNLQFDGTYKYRNKVPQFNNGEVIELYYTFTDSSGETYRVPENKNYKFVSGEKIISLNHGISQLPNDYVLSQNYPNPFNNTTKINFVTKTPDQTELIIFNILGQKVKTLFKGISRSGINVVTWDGTTDQGFKASSGAYYYLLKIGEYLFAKKMILLK